MLYPIVQALWQQFGPQIQQAVPYILSNMQHVKGPAMQITGLVIHTTSEKLQSLSDEDNQRLLGAAKWVAKDLAGDVATAATGLPIGPLVDKLVEKALDN